MSREFSPVWWREMDLRYGMYPPMAESHRDFTVALGRVHTRAHVVGSSAGAGGQLPAPPFDDAVHEPRSAQSRTTVRGRHSPRIPRLRAVPPQRGDQRWHEPGIPVRQEPPSFFVDSTDFCGILVPVVRPDGIKPSLLRYDKIFVADQVNNSTKRLNAQVPLIPCLKPQPWTNSKYKTTGSEGHGLYADGDF